MLVEDDALVCQVLEAMLRAEGAAVQSFSDPRRCLEGLGEEVPHLVITDLSLPEMDGFSLLRELRRRLGVRVPALATSAAPTARVQHECTAAGFDLLLPKPFRRSDLTQAVRTLVGR